MAMGNFVADLNVAVRQLVKSPLFLATATLTLALGIGANAAIFTVIESVVLAPLGYRNADRLMVLHTRSTDTGHESSRVTGPDGADVRAQSKSIEALSLYNGGESGVQLGDHAAFTNVTWVDENFARVFGLEPVAGRVFTNAEAHRAALVSEGFAIENFGSASAAVGRNLRVENEPLEIAGVLPAGFNFPDGTQVWEAVPLQPESNSRAAFNYHAGMLLRRESSVEAAGAELKGISKGLEEAYPTDNRNKQMVAVPLQKTLTGSVRPTLLLLWGTVGVILLIACVNVTNLQLVRSMERQKEIAIRKALGSTVWRVVQPVMMEGLLISLLGGAAGVLVAPWAVRVLVSMAPPGLPRAKEIHVNGWVLAMTLGLAVLTAVASSLIPALRAGSVGPLASLKRGAGGGGRGTAVVRNGLVIAEAAGTFVLAMGAGLLLHTMSTLMKRDVGYEPARLLVAGGEGPRP